MSVGTFQTNFSRGQLSTRIDTRIDTQSYQNGAKTISNLLVYLQGGARTRPGSFARSRIDEGGAALGATGIRVERMHIDRDEAYAIAFCESRAYIFRLTAGNVTLSQILTGQPWDATTMWYMTWEPYGSLGIIADQSFQTRKLLRTGLDSFTIETMEFEQRRDGKQSFQPYHKFADFDVTLAFSAYAVGSGVTCTASEAFFDANHVGQRFIVRGGEIQISSVASPTSATVAIVRELREILDPNPFSTHNGDDEVKCTWVGHGLVAGDTVNFANVADSVATGMTGANVNGSRTVSEVLNEDEFTFTAGANATGGVDFGGSDVWARSAAATRDWQEPAFSTFRGWPQAACVHDGRLWIGGSAGVPDGRWGSRPRSFFDFGLGEGNAADAIKAVGQTGAGNIRHMVSGDDLEIYSDISESFMPSSQEPLTQANVRAKTPTKHGAAYTKPLRFDGSTIFVDAVGQHIREFLYQDTGDGTYTASPVTALAHEVISQPNHSTIFDGSAEDATPYAIYTNDDGTAAFFHSARKEGIGGWSIQSTDGTFDSFCGIGERLFAGVIRDGAMYLEEWDFAYEARADGCQTLTASSTTSWTATYSYLKSATVDMFDGDGVYLGQTTTDASGNFTTPTAQTTVNVGLPADWELETLTPALTMSDGPVLGERALLSQAIAFVVDTTKIKLGLTTVLKATAYTGPLHFRTRGWSRNPTLPCSGSIAYAATVSGIRAEVF